MTLSALEAMAGSFWPYIVIVVFGFLPTEVWRVLGTVLGKGLDEDSELFHLVRFIATALVAAVITKLVIDPTGALAAIPMLARIGGLLGGVAVMLLVRRSTVAGLLSGVSLLVAVSLLLQGRA